MQRFAKKVLRTWLPGAYSYLSQLRTRLAIERGVIRQIGWRALLSKRFHDADSWQNTLPLQSARRVSIPGVQFRDLEALREHLASTGMSCAEGYYTVYLSPAVVRASAFRVLQADYPPGAGLKILKSPGGIDESAYVDSVIQQSLSYGDRHLPLVANLFSSRGIGPRLYDLIELACGDQVWSAYVVEHVEGRDPTVEEAKAGISRIRELESDGLIKTIATGGYDGVDFALPTCKGNAVIDADGHFRYIDFQNFALCNYGSFLVETAVRATEDSHFGGRRLLGGGAFIYQSIPGVQLPAKRDVARRVPMLDRLMATSQMSVRDRFVLDIGCNLGMMMAQYLRMGAKWCHGWDMPNVIDHTDKLLLALGCTRFSTTGATLESSRALVEDLPDFLKAALDGCVISYLAVRRHLGWLDALGEIPWSFLIYEGHEDEKPEDFERFADEFGSHARFHVGEVIEYEDGVCGKRTLAILRRD